MALLLSEPYRHGFIREIEQRCTFYSRATPSVEDMFEYAKTHNIWLGGLRDYVMYRLQKSLATWEGALADVELKKGTQKDVDKAILQNHYWLNLADRILAAEKKQDWSAK